MKSVGQFLYALPFKINQSVYPFYFTKEHSILFGKVDRA